MTSSPTATRRGFTVLIIALASALTLAACGDDAPAATTTSSTTTVALTPTEQLVAAVEAVGPRYAFTFTYTSGAPVQEDRTTGWMYDGVQYTDSNSSGTRFEYVSTADGQWSRPNGGRWDQVTDEGGVIDFAGWFLAPRTVEVIEDGGDTAVMQAVYDATDFGAADLDELTARITIVDGVMTMAVLELEAEDGSATLLTLTFDASADLAPIAVPPTADDPRPLEALPLTPIAATDPLVGTYVRGIPGNGWHIGAITAAPDGGHRWTNQGEHAWSLLWDDALGVLVTGEDSPYRGEEFDGAGDAFDIHFGDDGVTGFTFLDEQYDKVSDQPFGALSEFRIAGTYVTSIEGDTRNGVLTIEVDPAGPDLMDLPAPGGLRWTDTAGATRTLTWDPTTGRLVAEDGGAFDLQLGVDADGIVGVTSFTYLGETYTHLG